MTPLSREDALTRLRQCRDLQPGEGTMQVATGIVDALLEGADRYDDFIEGLTAKLNAAGVPAMPSWPDAIDWLIKRAAR